MTILSQILTLDRTLTLAINNCHAPFFDQFFFLFSRTAVWIPLFIVLTFTFFRSFGWRNALSIVLAVCLAVLLSDQLCNVFKYTVCRLRPTHEPSLQGMVHTVNGYLGGDYGFCSSHAANTVAITIFTSLLVRRWLYTLSLSSWVLLSCWSRIYLGVHYFGDIVCGLLVGALVSSIVYLLWRKTCWGLSVGTLPLKLSNTLAYTYYATVFILAVLPLLHAC